MLIDRNDRRCVRKLVSWIGDYEVAELTGANRQTVHLWHAGSGQAPSRQEADRLFSACRAFETVLRSHDVSFAKSWLLNHRLDDGLTPVAAIRQDRHDAVLQAARQV